jgi:hypothetical protein
MVENRLGYALQSIGDVTVRSQMSREGLIIVLDQDSSDIKYKCLENHRLVHKRRASRPRLDERSPADTSIVPFRIPAVVGFALAFLRVVVGDRGSIASI